MAAETAEGTGSGWVAGWRGGPGLGSWGGSRLGWWGATWSPEPPQAGPRPEPSRHHAGQQERATNHPCDRSRGGACGQPREPRPPVGYCPHRGRKLRCGGRGRGRRCERRSGRGCGRALRSGGGTWGRVPARGRRAGGGSRVVARPSRTMVVARLSIRPTRPVVARPGPARTMTGTRPRPVSPIVARGGEGGNGSGGEGEEGREGEGGEAGPHREVLSEWCCVRPCHRGWVGFVTVARWTSLSS
jgi:hypothetical protein